MSVQRRSFTAKKAEPREEWLYASASKVVGKAEVLVSGTGTDHASSTFFVARLPPYCYSYSAVSIVPVWLKALHELVVPWILFCLISSTSAKKRLALARHIQLWGKVTNNCGNRLWAVRKWCEQVSLNKKVFEKPTIFCVLLLFTCRSSQSYKLSLTFGSLRSTVEAKKTRK